MNAVEYFSNMSNLAGRISSDIELTKCTYQELWSDLNPIERDQVINEAIIDPAVVLKYNSHSQGVGKIKANSKFSWFTKSQLDLYSESVKENEKTETSQTTRKKGPAPEPPVRKDTTVLNHQSRPHSTVDVPTAPTQPLRVIVPSPVLAMKKRALIASPPSEPNNLFGRLKHRQKTEDRQPLVQTEQPISVKPVTKQPESLHPSNHSSVNQSSRLAKPKTPPPPPPSVSTKTESLSLLSHDEIDSIPKTGFDFLDNW